MRFFKAVGLKILKKNHFLEIKLSRWLTGFHCICKVVNILDNEVYIANVTLKIRKAQFRGPFLFSLSRHGKELWGRLAEGIC